MGRIVSHGISFDGEHAIFKEKNVSALQYKNSWSPSVRGSTVFRALIADRILKMICEQ